MTIKQEWLQAGYCVHYDKIDNRELTLIKIVVAVRGQEMSVKHVYKHHTIYQYVCRIYTFHI